MSLVKNTASQGVYLAAYDTTASPVAGKASDQANITGAWSKDGGAETAGFTTANPTNIGGGIYWQPLTQAETNGDQLSFRWVSSTSGVVIDPLFITTIASAAAAPTAAAIATAIFTDLLASSDFSTSSSFGKLIKDNLDAVVSAIKAKTDLIPASPASTTNITAGTITTTTNLTNLPAIPNNWLTAAGIAAGALTSVWDEVNTGATHNLANSTGKQLRSITAGATDAIYPLAGTVNLTAATSTTATLDGSASAVSQAYQWDVLNILSGTGAGQSRIITNYTTGRVATVSPAFSTTPDATSTFDITPTASVQVVSYITGQDPATLVWGAATRTLTTTIPTAAQIATAVWTDTTAGDFTTATSPGKIIFSQLGGAFTTTSSSVFSTAALANGPTGGSAPSAATVAAAVWDEVLTAATHNIVSSAGKILRLINPTSNVIRSGTLPDQSGMTSTQVKLDSGASSVDGVYVDDVISITSGSPAGESAIILGYEGSSRLATLDRAWVIQPAAGNQFEITPLTTVAVAGTVTVGALTPAALADFFSIDSGTIYSAAVSGSVVKEIGGFITSTSGPTPATIAAAVWQDLLDGGDFDTADSIGAWLLAHSAPQATIASATSTTVTLPALDVNSQSIPDDGRYVNGILRVVSGTGRGQVVVLTDPTGTARQYGVRPGSMPVPLDSTSGIQFAGTTASSVHSFTAPALAEFFTVVTTKVFGDAVAGSVVKEIATGTGSDPWAVHLPGSYLSGTAGWIIGNRIDVSLSSLSTYAGTDTPGVGTLLQRISSAITINGGGVAIDWAHVLNPTSTVALTNTTISPSQVVASVTGNVGGTINGFTTAALAQFFTTNTTKVYADAVSGSVVKEISTNAGGGGTSTLTASDVWSYATRTLTSLGAHAPAGWIDAASIVNHALDGKGDWSTYDGSDTTGVTTLLTRIGSTITITGGAVNVNMAQAVPTSNTAQTHGDSLNAARAQGFGRWVLDPNAKTLTVYAADGTTVVRIFNVDSGSAPLTRS